MNYLPVKEDHGSATHGSMMPEDGKGVLFSTYNNTFASYKGCGLGRVDKQDKHLYRFCLNVCFSLYFVSTT